MSFEQKPKRPLAPLPDGLPAAVAALAEELRRGRDATDLSLAALASHVFSSKASVSRWLAGAATPTREQACRWAEVCGTGVPRMGELWDALESPAKPSDESSGVDANAGFPVAGSWWRVSMFRILVAAGALIGVGAALHASVNVRCPAHRVELQVPSISGRAMGVTMQVVCAPTADRTYLLIEEVPDVDPDNRHSVYFVKAYLTRPERGRSTSDQLLLEEPVGTKAMFYVISVDDSGLHAIEQNRVVDEGVLQLPRGFRLESDIIWHVKKWQGS